MKILLIDIDSKIPNLALKKIESYYQKKNCEIDWNLPFNNSSFISMRKETGRP